MLTRARADGLRVVGAAVAAPGLVDTAGGRLLRAPNLGWNDIAVADVLRGLLTVGDLPITVDNEANLAALAELWDGVGERLDSFIHVSGEIGVGAGIVMGGRLHRGVRGFAGELGHVAVRPFGGDLCACGARGCLETIAGIDVIRERAGLAPPVEGGAYATAEALAEAASKGDSAALVAFDEAAQALGIGLAGAVNLLDVEAVIIGGGLGTRLGEPYTKRIEAAMLPHLFVEERPPSVHVAALGDLGGAIGAARMVPRTTRPARRRARSGPSA
jgi:predicted NBD/HSP70 family sugar kinase